MTRHEFNNSSRSKGIFWSSTMPRSLSSSDFDLQSAFVLSSLLTHHLPKTQTDLWDENYRYCEHMGHRLSEVRRLRSQASPRHVPSLILKTSPRTAITIIAKPHSGSKSIKLLHNTSGCRLFTPQANVLIGRSSTSAVRRLTELDWGPCYASCSLDLFAARRSWRGGMWTWGILGALYRAKVLVYVSHTVLLVSFIWVHRHSWEFGLLLNHWGCTSASWRVVVCSRELVGEKPVWYGNCTYFSILVI